jgi:hypothetical protein
MSIRFILSVTYCIRGIKVNVSPSFQAPPQKDKEMEEEVIKTDLSKLSTRQKLALLQKESPEFFGLVQDFKGKVYLLEVTVQLCVALL